MARKLRYFGKKRGNRRTGSRLLGSAGEAVFFAVLLLLGAGGLVAIVAFLIVPQWRVNHDFVETTCRVEKKRIGRMESEDGARFRPELKVEYRVDEVTYHSPWVYDINHAYSSDRAQQESLLSRFDVGEQVACWYNPADPNVVVIARGYTWWIWLLLVIPTSFIVTGGGGFIYAILHWGRSTERRAALTRRVQQHVPFRTNGHRAGAMPFVPDHSDITNSPGTRLRFRLPIGTSPGWALIGVLVACLAWNGMVSVFAATAVGGFRRGEPDWLLVAFVVPFAIAGIGLFALFIRQFLLTTGIGPTLLEVSEHPLRPGQQCQLFVSQSGRLSIRSLAVLLVCEEAATFRQGTDVRTESREVFRREIFSRDRFDVRHGVPFEAECDLLVPTDAMHSFKAEHNEINWKLVVEADLDGWPQYKRDFPVVVYPRNGRADG